MPYRLPTPELETQAHHIRSVRPSRLRVDSLWAIAIRQIGVDNERATDLIAQARAVADQLHYNTGMALCDIATAMLALDEGTIEKAVLLIQEIEATLPEDEHLHGWISLIHATFAFRELKPLDAMEKALRAYENLALVGDIVGMGKALMVLGFGFSNLNDPTTALAYHIEHYNLTEPLEDAALSLVPLSQIVETAFYLSRFDDATPYVIEGLELCRALAEENDNAFAQEMYVRFAGYELQLDGKQMPINTPLEQTTPFPDINYRAALLPIQREMVEIQFTLQDEYASPAIALEMVSEELAHHRANMKRLLERDALTWLFHRGYLEKMLPSIMELSGKIEVPLTVMLFDIDHLTAANDRYGYLWTEKLLNYFGTLILNTFAPQLLSVRFGSDCFLVVCTGHDGEHTYALAETWRTTVAKTSWTIDGVSTAPLTISVGITTYQEGDTSEIVFERVEDALNRAKQAGGNRVESV